MSFEEVMEALKAAGTEQNRKIYPRHGVKNELYGVSFADLGNYVITDYFADYVFQTPQARQKMEAWTQADDEWLGQAGWRLVAKFALQDPTLPDPYFVSHLVQIEREIHARKNRVRDARNSALIAIGVRNAMLQEEALEAAGKIGKVAVDHGQTSCKTPDAAGHILKTVKHREEKRVVSQI